MLPKTSFQIQQLKEEDVEKIVLDAGGRRAYSDQQSVQTPNADFILGNAIVELKILEYESIAKKERHAKLAALFSDKNEKRPVFVLDVAALEDERRTQYYRIMEGPIKQAIRSAKKQLKQSRTDFPTSKRSILMIVNSSNTSLSHGEIIELVERRAKNDTSSIDGVIVAGAYIASDGFDTRAIWPIDYVQIQAGKDFAEFESLRSAFNEYAEQVMTAAIVNPSSPGTVKGPILDLSFEFEGKTYVKTAPLMGFPSKFYRNGRPRLDSTGIDRCPIVGTTFPNLSKIEWNKLHEKVTDLTIEDNYGDWLERLNDASNSGSDLVPLVPMDVTLKDWENARQKNVDSNAFSIISSIAHKRFDAELRNILDRACEVRDSTILVSKYIHVVTEIIGQDEVLDVSHIYLVTETISNGTVRELLVGNLQIKKLHARALGAAYAIKHNASQLMWELDMEYAWS